MAKVKFTGRHFSNSGAYFERNQVAEATEPPEYYKGIAVFLDEDTESDEEQLELPLDPEEGTLKKLSKAENKKGKFGGVEL